MLLDSYGILKVTPEQFGRLERPKLLAFSPKFFLTEIPIQILKHGEQILYRQITAESCVRHDDPNILLANQGLILEEKKKEVEAELERAIRKGRSCGMSDSEIQTLFQLILEE